MALSKLFTPKLRETRGAALDKEAGGIFLSPPTHPEIPLVDAPTDKGQAIYPLKLGADNGSFTEKPGKREVTSSPQEDTKY